jgi:endonuclease YncB( thermonuclease family)
MTDRIKWVYLAAGLLAGAAAVFIADRFPGGRGVGGRLELRYDEGRTYRVERVVDGDTVVIEGGAHLRYIGVDTPEMGRFDYSKPDPFSQEATDFNKRLVEGRQVRLAFGSEKLDRYGRMLAGVLVQDQRTGQWLDVSEELARAGLARRMTNVGRVPNEGRLIRAEEAARAAGLGVHSRSAEKPGPERPGPAPSP